MKKQHKIIRYKKREDTAENNDGQEYEFDRVPRNNNIVKSVTRVSKASLGDRLNKEGFATVVTGTGGNREMKFSMRGEKSESDNLQKMKKHHQERKQIARKTGFLMKKKPPRRF